ncbi:MAG: hypothetical protein ACREQY_12775, partial [Candidatus Binatia bacterium]
MVAALLVSTVMTAGGCGSERGDAVRFEGNVEEVTRTAFSPAGGGAAYAGGLVWQRLLGIAFPVAVAQRCTGDAKHVLACARSVAGQAGCDDLIESCSAIDPERCEFSVEVSVPSDCEDAGTIRFVQDDDRDGSAAVGEREAELVLPASIYPLCN